MTFVPISWILCSRVILFNEVKFYLYVWLFKLFLDFDSSLHLLYFVCLADCLKLYDLNIDIKVLDSDCVWTPSSVNHRQQFLAKYAMYHILFFCFSKNIMC